MNWSIDGETGDIVPTSELKVWEPLVVKLQAYKTALEVRLFAFPIKFGKLEQPTTETQIPFAIFKVPEGRE